MNTLVMQWDHRSNGEKGTFGDHLISKQLTTRGWLGGCSAGLWVSPSMEAPQALWTTCARVDPPVPPSSLWSSAGMCSSMSLSLWSWEAQTLLPCIVCVFFMFFLGPACASMRPFATSCSWLTARLSLLLENVVFEIPTWKVPHPQLWSRIYLSSLT